ncbi:uncharacterized protein LOC108108505 [Drosophila eugracilis]|uniref:uncharacterized protein LOC108108505 n=1 Tax=Drosophila eugracilis TaxID=29029 RepID=UPI0007E67264|nr:uncharacterized protein LOC108108505 [Drosophila eugracilis]
MRNNLIPLFGAVFAVNFMFNDAVVFRFTNFECKSYNESWFVFHYYRLKAVSRDRVLLNVNGTILHPANDIQLRGKMFKKASGFKPWVLDSTVDGCRYMRKRYDPFLNIVFNIFKDFSNINHTCPFFGPQVVKDFYLRSERLALPFPSGEYMLALLWYFDKKRIFDTNVSFLYQEDLLRMT